MGKDEEVRKREGEKGPRRDREGKRRKDKGISLTRLGYGKETEKVETHLINT